MKLHEIILIVSDIIFLIGVIAPIFIKLKRITEGQKCQLRSEMLRIYYHNMDNEKIRQYEYENFAMLYNAYKALGGNSFIDKIKADVSKWEVLT